MTQRTSHMHCPVGHHATENTGPAAVGRCPFHHGQVSADTSAQIETEPGSSAAQPSSEAHAALNGCPMGYTASEPVQQPSDQAACPMGHGVQNGAGRQSSEAAPAQCPMGFTAADGPRMTAFHCVICKSLLYDCVQLSCACKYCRHCVANFRDCPLCGADITSRTPDTELQEMVDKYIAAHAGTQNLFDMGKAQHDAKVEEANSKTRSAFLLQLAVRSAAGGNHPAAIHRLQLCKAELLQQVKDEGHTCSLCSQLGAVCGSQGDCHRQLNQPQEAKSSYEESVQHLKACDRDDAEIAHALSVSYNKLGDLEYGFDHVQAAVDWYQKGLAIREQALQNNTQAGPSEQLDVAVSTIKVADACQALGRDQEAETSFNKALRLVQDVQSSSQHDAAVLSKCKGLLSFLETRQLK